MQLTTKNKTINLVFTTRKIVNISNVLKGRNFEDLYFKAMNENDLDALSKIIYTFAEDEAGMKSFKSSEEVYDFMDDYKQENEKTYQDIFSEMAGAINEEGFFKTKMNKKDLAQKISNPLSGVNMEEIIKTSAEKAITKMTEQEISKGYKA
ncbi:MAG: hypothetical protein HFJ32_04580 [Clostridia bacterium]|nr:hypothetical protein [Clostridia bacterium]